MWLHVTPQYDVMTSHNVCLSKKRDLGAKGLYNLGNAGGTWTLRRFHLLSFLSKYVCIICHGVNLFILAIHVIGPFVSKKSLYLNKPFFIYCREGRNWSRGLNHTTTTVICSTTFWVSKINLYSLSLYITLSNRNRQNNLPLWTNWMVLHTDTHFLHYFFKSHPVAFTPLLTPPFKFAHCIPTNFKN